MLTTAKIRCYMHDCGPIRILNNVRALTEIYFFYKSILLSIESTFVPLCSFVLLFLLLSVVGTLL